MFSALDTSERNEVYVYFNGNKLPESYHYTNYGGKSYIRSTGGREVTVAASARDTIYLRTGTMKDGFHQILFCVAFENEI